MSAPASSLTKTSPEKSLTSKHPHHQKPKTYPLPLILPPSRTFLTFLLSFFQTPLLFQPKHGIFVPFGRCVLIIRQEDASSLWLGGFFGKGNLSRGEATWWGRRMRELGARVDGPLSIEEISERRRKKRKEKKSGLNVEKDEKVNSEIVMEEKSEGGKMNNSVEVEVPEILNVEKIVDIPEIENVEHHQLNLCEAFFLAWGVGALAIFDIKNRRLSIPDLWNSFLSASSPTNHLCVNNPFVIQYVAYHYYRSRGWVAKSGIKFGVDLVLYKKGPIFHHAEFAVIVIPTFQEISVIPSGHSNTWENFLGINRVAGQVKKTVLLCHVLLPTDVTEKEMASPTVLGRYRVREVLMKRWIAEKNRD